MGERWAMNEQVGQSGAPGALALYLWGSTDLECDGIGKPCTKSLGNRMPAIITITCRDERGQLGFRASSPDAASPWASREREFETLG